MLVVAFGHRKYVGKDTCARLLSTILKTNTRGLNIQRKGFADKLKDDCYSLYGWAGLKPRQHYDEQGREKEKDAILPVIGKSARQIWIEYGMAMRAIYEHTWVDYLFKGTRADVLLITDMRFDNEFDRVESLGGLRYRVDNPRIPPTDDVADKPLACKPASAWTGIIENAGSLQNLNAHLENIAREIILPKLKAA